MAGEGWRRVVIYRGRLAGELGGKADVALPRVCC